MKAKVIKISGNKVTFEFDEEVYINTLSRDKEGFINAEIQFDDDRFISADQRKHFYALVGDVSEYMGNPIDATEAWLKYRFMNEKSLDEFPSLAREAMSREMASDLIEFVVLWCIHEGVPFRKQQWYLSTDDSKVLYALTQKRLCAVCGKPNADIHHINAIGAGRNRKTIDHGSHKFLALCREHHNESHAIGQKTFMDKYLLKPVKLIDEDLKKLGV